MKNVIKMIPNTYISRFIQWICRRSGKEDTSEEKQRRKDTFKKLICTIK